MENQDLTFLMHEDRANGISKGVWNTGARLREGRFARHHTPRPTQSGQSAPRGLGPQPMAFALHSVAAGGKLAMASLSAPFWAWLFRLSWTLPQSPDHRESLPAQSKPHAPGPNHLRDSGKD